MGEWKIRVLQRGSACQEENGIDMQKELEARSSVASEGQKEESFLFPLSLEINDSLLYPFSNPFTHLKLFERVPDPCCQHALNKKNTETKDIVYFN